MRPADPKDPLWEELAALPAPVPDTQATDRIAQQLQNAIHRKEPRMKPSLLAAAMIAGALLGGAGTSLWQKREAPPAGEQFILLLHEDSKPSQVDAATLKGIIGEYIAWADRLRAQNRLVSAEKLRDDGGQWLAGNGAGKDTDPTDAIGGFYLVRAANYEEAKSIAKDSPHLKYGGTIEVRQIESTTGK
jgi:hypothetical protein